MFFTIRTATITLAACGVSAMLVTAAAEAAPVAAISYNGALTSGRADNDYTVGDEFLVGSQNLVLSSLGVQDINGSGMTGVGIYNPPVSVGLWNASGTVLLATAQVNNSDPAQAGGYRYASIAPITLTAGTDYLIGAYVGAGIEWFGDAGSSNDYSSSLVTLVNDVYNYNGATGMQAPLSSGGGAIGRWGPANFLATVVPEPSSVVAWCGLGAMALCLVIRRRRGR